MNPCPCGFRGDTRRECRCRPWDLINHDAKISGPLLDRIDIEVSVERQRKGELLRSERGEPSAVIRERVDAARRLQHERYGPGVTNATVPRKVLDQLVCLSDGATAELKMATEGLDLSGRGIERVLRVARTIADLRGQTTVDADHIGEAIALRTRDRRAEVAA